MITTAHFRCNRNQKSPDALPCSVPNALPGKDSVNIEIFGMAGVPDGATPGGAPLAGIALAESRHGSIV